MKTNMHFGATPIIFKRAQQLRSEPTEAEQILWEYLKKNFNQYRFRRQHPMDKYVVDLYSHKLKLVIEIDGEIHNSDQNLKDDLDREIQLNSFGLNILRFTNEEIYHELEKVHIHIDHIIRTIEADI